MLALLSKKLSSIEKTEHVKVGESGEVIPNDYSHYTSPSLQTVASCYVFVFCFSFLITSRDHILSTSTCTNA